MRESRIERMFREVVEEQGGACFKFRPIENGYPDRVVLFPGAKAGFVELKATNKDLRKLQDVRKKELEKLGFLVYKVDVPDKSLMVEICKEVKRQQQAWGEWGYE